MFDFTAITSAMSPAARVLAAKRAAEALADGAPIGTRVCIPTQDCGEIYWRKAPRFFVRINAAEYIAAREG